MSRQDPFQTPEEMEFFLQALPSPLLAWYGQNARRLPWRSEPTPYRVWISEIMLQQTRVSAGLDYFQRWMKELPDVAALANVSDDRLMKLWEGLGYYNRARNLKKAAGIVMEQYGGEIPNTYEALLSLPGIGPYTAGAIASIAFGLAVPAVDGNVLRVLARILASSSDISSPRTKAWMEQVMKSVMPQDRPGDFNQAMMELGAMICIPNGAPKCGACPAARLCQAKKENLTDRLPVKGVKKPRVIQEKTVLILRWSGRILLHRRKEEGLLAGLWELPNAEGNLTETEVRRLLKDAGLTAAGILPLEKAKHIFSHVEWHMTGYDVTLEDAGLDQARDTAGGSAKGRVSEETLVYSRDTEKKKPEYLWVNPGDLEHGYSIPSAFKAYRSLLFPE